MCKLTLPLVVFLLLSATARAQVPLNAVLPLTSSAQSVIWPPPYPPAELQSNGQSHGWSTAQKGALIGAGAGVGAGIALGLVLCDGAHCYTSGYIKAAAICGGIGAGIGALIGSAIDHPRRGANPFPAARPKIGISPIVSQQTRGGVVTVGF